MITGNVNWRDEAIVSLQISNDAGDSEVLDVVIDTGFSDYLSLPPTTIQALSLPFVQTDNYELADGTSVVFSIHRATVSWDGQMRVVTVLAAEGGALLGMRLLKGAWVSLHVVDGGIVRIEPGP